MNCNCDFCERTIVLLERYRDRLRLHRVWAYAQVVWAVGFLTLSFVMGIDSRFRWLVELSDGVLLALGVIFVFRIVDLTRLIRQIRSTLASSNS